MSLFGKDPEAGQMPQGLFDLYEATLDAPGVQDLSMLYENPVQDNPAVFDTSDTPPVYEANLDASDGGDNQSMSMDDLNQTQDDLEQNSDGISNLLTKKAQDRENATQMFQSKVADVNKQRGY